MFKVPSLKNRNLKYLSLPSKQKDICVTLLQFFLKIVPSVSFTLLLKVL